MMTKYLAEFIGTFMLLFAGAGAIVINDATGGLITHVGIALTFGLVVLAVIYTIGDVSGAHINPAVTIGFWIGGQFHRRQVVPYIGCQLAGATVACFVLRLLYPGHPTMGATLPIVGIWQAFLLEIILTWFLMFVVLNVSTGAKEKGITAGIVVGSVVALEAMFAGPACGASMNPARSFGPAIVVATNRINEKSDLAVSALWIYLAAPVIGAALAVVTFWLIRPEDKP
jgi:aquaporin Z